MQQADRQQIDRSKWVIVFKGLKLNHIHCNVCKGYTGDVHGTCPCYPYKTCGHVYGSFEKVPSFNNTKYVAIAIIGLPCRGKQYGCTYSCDGCVIVKRKIVIKGDS